MKSSIEPLDPRLGRIFFYRTYNFIGSGVQPDLSLNGSQVGKSIPGGFFYTDCAPGNYVLEGGSDHGFFPEEFKLSFQVEAGRSIYIKTSAVGKPCALIDPDTGSAEVGRLRYDGSFAEPALAAKQALEADEDRRRKAAEEERRKKLAEEERQQTLAEFSGKEGSASTIFKLTPSEQFSLTETTELLLTWKNQHLADLLQHAKTKELRSYVDEIEHTILQATDAAEREKDDAQRVVASGANGESRHTELARAYHLRIEVLKPILSAIKQEVADRAK